MEKTVFWHLQSQTWNTVWYRWTS